MKTEETLDKLEFSIKFGDQVKSIREQLKEQGFECDETKIEKFQTIYDIV